MCYLRNRCTYAFTQVTNGGYFHQCRLGSQQNLVGTNLANLHWPYKKCLYINLLPKDIVYLFFQDNIRDTLAQIKSYLQTLWSSVARSVKHSLTSGGLSLRLDSSLFFARTGFSQLEFHTVIVHQKLILILTLAQYWYSLSDILYIILGILTNVFIFAEKRLSKVVLYLHSNSLTI